MHMPIPKVKEAPTDGTNPTLQTLYPYATKKVS